MNARHPKRVEDYTTANIILIAINLFWIMGVIWVTWGFVPTMVFALVVNHGLTRVAQVRARRAQRPMGVPDRG